MCYYCRYLAHEKSISYDDVDLHYSNELKSRAKRSCHLDTFIRLIVITSFFVMLNVTIVLSQSSQIQQQRDQSSSKILEQNSQGRRRRKVNFLMFT